MSTRTITKTEQERRAEVVRQARHGTEMKGGHTDEATRADQDAYVRGELSVDEVTARTKDRHGG